MNIEFLSSILVLIGLGMFVVPPLVLVVCGLYVFLTKAEARKSFWDDIMRLHFETQGNPLKMLRFQGRPPKGIPTWILDHHDTFFLVMLAGLILLGVGAGLT